MGGHPPGPQWTAEEERELLMLVLQQALDQGFVARLSGIHMPTRTRKAVTHRWNEIRSSMRCLGTGDLAATVATPSTASSRATKSGSGNKKRAASVDNSTKIGKKGRHAPKGTSGVKGSSRYKSRAEMAEDNQEDKVEADEEEEEEDNREDFFYNGDLLSDYKRNSLDKDNDDGDDEFRGGSNALFGHITSLVEAGQV